MNAYSEHTDRIETTHSRRRDSIALGLLVIALLGVTAINLAVGPIWQPGTPVRAAWCRNDQIPRFEFGFGDLARQLGDIMGEPTECEHGEAWTTDTRQETTTGVAFYYWCTNTPTFTRGQEHWMVTSNGVEHWTDGGPPPSGQPVVHQPNLRQPCSP